MAIRDVAGANLATILSLKGRHAVVTGAAKGLGRAIAARLAEAGAAVLLADIDVENAQAAAAELAKRHGVQAIATRLDVRDSKSVAATAALAEQELGGIDIWVNNAGIFPLTPVLRMTDEDWDSVININLRGTFLGARAAAQSMAKAGTGGVIVNIASTAGFKGAGPGITHYVASKHGVRGITRQMALELAGQNIRVLGVAPTAIITEGVHDVMQHNVAEAGFDLDKVLDNLLGRPGVPDDVARVVLFCASDMSLFMTGSTLLVDAGELTQ